MKRYVAKTGVTLEACQFLMHSPCPGVIKYCNNFIVKSKVGLQSIKNYDYVIRTPSGGYLAVPQEVFEFLMEPING